MNPQRTPPRATFISGSEKAGGSVPNLSTYDSKDLLEHITIRERKRKERAEEQDYKRDFTNFQSVILNLMDEFGKTQNETLRQIRDEISEVKNEIKTIQLTTDTFTKQFAQINNEIQNIKTNNTITQDKIKIIENEISQIKEQQFTKSSTSQPLTLAAPPALDHENLILEVKDRCDREKNVVIAGISEINDSNYKARQIYDMEEVVKMLQSLYEDCPKPVKCMRLGKYIPNKNRAIKVCFSNTDTPKHLLRNKLKTPENIQIYSDQTPTQQRYMQSLKEELNKRKEKGESDLTIRYIKGTPRIVVNAINSKN